MSAMRDATALVEEALDLVGDDGLRTIILAMGKAQLTLAVELLFSQGWWTAELTVVLRQPTSVQAMVLGRLMDKLLPSPKATELPTERPASFTVNYGPPPEEEA